MNKLLLTTCCFSSILILSQKNNYKYITEDQYKNKIYDKFESKEGDKITIWQKIEESLENNPSTAFTEYNLQIDCKAKTSILKTVVIHWRDGNIQKLDDSPKEIPITNPNSIIGLSYQNHCRK
jgi:hypothetical protein